MNIEALIKKEKFYLDVSATVGEALAMMQENKNGSVVLVENNRPYGIISESDVIARLKDDFGLEQPARLLAFRQLISIRRTHSVDFALNLMNSNNIRRLVVTDDKGHFSGVILQEDVIHHLEEDIYKVHLRVKDIITKNKELFDVPYDATVSEAIALIKEYKIGSLLVRKEREHVGILTERDIIKLLKERVSPREKLRGYYSSPVLSCTTDTLVVNAIDMMKQKSIRRLLVKENDRSVAIITNRDILKRIRNNYAALLEAKVRHAKEFLDTLHEPIIDVSVEGDSAIIHWMNQRAKSLFGEELLNTELRNLIGKKQCGVIKKTIRKQSKTTFELEIKGSNYEVSATKEKQLEFINVKLIFRDISEHIRIKKDLMHELNEEIQKRVENEYLLMQQSKLAALGEMVGFIAHQWRQPLSQISGIFLSQILAYEYGKLNKKFLEEKVELGNNILKYMSSTLDDFKDFFSNTNEDGCFAICDAIKSSVAILEATLIYNHIALQFECDKIKQNYTINGSQSEFSQVILNILNNAKDILCERDVQKKEIYVTLYSEKEVYCLEIEDNAGGIPPEIVGRVFERDFTTKKGSRGTGVGLHIAKLIIEQKMGGSIQAANTKRGAKFSIRLHPFSN